MTSTCVPGWSVHVCFFPAGNWRKPIGFFDNVFLQLFIFASKCFEMSGAGGCFCKDSFLPKEILFHLLTARKNRTNECGLFTRCGPWAWNLWYIKLLVAVFFHQTTITPSTGKKQQKFEKKNGRFGRFLIFLVDLIFVPSPNRPWKFSWRYPSLGDKKPPGFTF